MSITGSLKIEREANASLPEMDQQIQAAGRGAMQTALKEALHQREEQEQSCPACGSDRCHPPGTKRRVLLTSFGRVEVPLKRLRCWPCRHRFRPAASCLAEVQGENVTPALRELAALVGSSWPSETAAGVLKQLSGVQLSDERLRQLTNEQGSCLARQHQEHAQQVLADASTLSLIRRARAPTEPVAKPEPPEWVQGGLDGGWVPSREQKGGMEGKIGVVASHGEPVGNHGRDRLSQRRSVATCGSAEEVGMLTSAAASAPSGNGGQASRWCWAMGRTGSKPKPRSTFLRR